MGRPIDEDSVIDIVMYECGEWTGLAKEIVKQIKALPSAEPQWIPCNEILPYAENGESDNVLATCGYRNVEDTSIRWVSRLWFDGKYWHNVEGERFNQTVYAWMPLPKPYKDGKQNY